MKKRLIVTYMICTLLFLVGCDSQTTEIDYETWRQSDEAVDMNSDRKIDEVDFGLYNDYMTWRFSATAEDLNGDRKINELDFMLFLDLPINDYATWISSDEADDMNDDGQTDEDDFEIYLEYVEMAGDYHVIDYSYFGPTDINVGDVSARDLGQYLDNVVITVDRNGIVSAELPSDIVSALGDLYPLMVEGLGNMRLTWISRFLVGMDTSITVDDIEYPLTLYFSVTAEGYSTSIDMVVGDRAATIGFALVKAESME